MNFLILEIWWKAGGRLWSVLIDKCVLPRQRAVREQGWLGRALERRTSAEVCQASANGHSIMLALGRRIQLKSYGITLPRLNSVLFSTVSYVLGIRSYEKPV
jgi:hypothetical protein